MVDSQTWERYNIGLRKLILCPTLCFLLRGNGGQVGDVADDVATVVAVEERGGDGGDGLRSVGYVSRWLA